MKLCCSVVNLIFSIALTLVAYPGETNAQTILQEQELVPSNWTEPNLGFGHAVDFYGDRMVVGGGFDSTFDFGAGIAYLYEFQGGAWVETQTITPVDVATTEYGSFGSVAAMHGKYIALSGVEILLRSEPNPWEWPELGDPQVYRGVVFVFELVNGLWTETTKLTVDHLANTPNDTGTFGNNLAIFGDTLVAGWADLNSGPTRIETVFVFERTETGWSLAGHIQPPCANCSFGNAIGMYENTLAISSVYKNNTLDGSVFMYERINNSWQLLAELKPADGAPGDEFGNRLSLFGDSLLVGAVRDNDNGALSGSAYEFERISGVWTETNKIKPQVGGPYQYFSYWLDHNGSSAVISEYDAYSGTPNDPGYFDHYETSLFKKLNGSWSEVGYLERFPTDVDGRHGDRVAVKGNTFAVSNRYYAPGGSLGNQGRVWIYSYIPSTDTSTPVGDDVEVVPTVSDPSGNPVSDAPEFKFSFESIDTAGDTTVTVVDSSPETTTPPLGFSILGFNDSSALFDFHTTATMVPGSTVEICIDYSSMDIAGDPADLIFAHEVNGEWVDITSSNDVGQEIICGVTDSFSYFALFESADPIRLLEDLIQAVAALNAKHGIVNSLDAKLGAAKQALTDARKNNDLSAINVLMSSFINAVEAQRGNQILEAEADDLISRALEIIAAIEGGVSS